MCILLGIGRDTNTQSLPSGIYNPENVLPKLVSVPWVVQN